MFNNLDTIPDSKVHGAHMGSTWVLSAPDGPHVRPMNLAIRDMSQTIDQDTKTEDGNLIVIDSIR